MAKRLLPILLLLLTPLVADNEAGQDRLRADVEFLASDKLIGRDAYNEGSDIAARFLKTRLTQLGFKKIPGAKDYLIPFEVHKRTLENVAGWWEGETDEVIVLGAHYDHVGQRRAKKDDAKDEDRIFNGANDNASGTAGVLEIARQLKVAKKFRRGLVVVLFDGEEKGLLGSRAFARDVEKLLPKKKIVAMINLDMIGLFKEDTIDIMGVGTSSRWPSILNKFDTMKWKDFGYIPNSDHHNFYKLKVPVLFPFCGLDENYHGVGDEANTLDYKKMAKVANYIGSVTKFLVNDDKGMDFKEISKKVLLLSQQKVFGGLKKVRLGISFADPKEMVIGTVEPKSRAHILGLKTGDQLVALNGKSLDGFNDLRKKLGKFKKSADIVSLDVLRKGKLLALESSAK